MKLLSFIMLICMSINVATQQYKPMLSENNEWHLTSCYFGCITDVYITQDDTVVNGLPYKILDGFHYISRKFLLREDITEKKVYFLYAEATKPEEFLLYDFSLDVGDSIIMNNPLTPFPDDGGWFLLDSINQALIADGNSYRHFYFSPTASNSISSDPAIWIESIGSLSIVNAPGGYPSESGAGHVTCMFKNGEVHYRKLDSISDCAQQYNLSISNKVPINFTISPNIIINELNLFLDLPKANLAVYNMEGKLIKQITLAKGKSKIGINEPAGMYIAILSTTDGQLAIRKLIIQ